MDEQPVRGAHAVVEVRVRRPGGEGAHQRVEHGQEREQRRPPALAAGNVVLAGGATAKVVEVGEQPEILLPLLVEGAAQTLSLVVGSDGPVIVVGGVHPINRAQPAFLSSASVNSASTTSPSFGPPERCCGPPPVVPLRPPRYIAWVGLWEAGVRLSWATRIRGTASASEAQPASLMACARTAPSAPQG